MLPQELIRRKRDGGELEAHEIEWLVRTGGVGDKVSLLPAPIVVACAGAVPHDDRRPRPR